MRFLPEHPRVPLERTLSDNLMDGTAIAGLLVSWTIVLTAWSDLPDSVPRHFGLAGEPDAWGPRWLLFLFPAIGVLLATGLLSLLRIPHHFNYPWPITPENAPVQYKRARKVIQVLNLLLQWFFCAIVWEIKEMALGREEAIYPLLTPLFLLAIFSLIFGYLIFGKRMPIQQGDYP